MLYSIRDYRKNPSTLEQEALWLSQAFYDAVVTAKVELESVLNTPLAQFSSMLVPQEILDHEERLILQHRGLQDQIILDVDNNKREVRGEESNIDDDAQLAATIESGMDLNADFVVLQY